MASNCPVSTTRLRQISNDACDSALSTATAYDHAQTQEWNNTIINTILKSLISESQSASPDAKYKFCVNSTIIQHLSDPRPSGTGASAGTSTTADVGVGPSADDAKVDGEKTAGDAAVEGEEDLKKEVEGQESAAGVAPKVGRRGMHSASGAYWNNAKDGMWSHKYEGGESKGMDIVVSIMWIMV